MNWCIIRVYPYFTEIIMRYKGNIGAHCGSGDGWQRTFWSYRRVISLFYMLLYTTKLPYSRRVGSRLGCWDPICLICVSGVGLIPGRETFRSFLWENGTVLGLKTSKPQQLRFWFYLPEWTRPLDRHHMDPMSSCPLLYLWCIMISAYMSLRGCELRYRRFEG